MSKKLTMIAIGSRGDVQPCVALGKALMQAGYTVRIATMENFKSLVVDNGLEFFHVEGDAHALTSEITKGNDGVLQMFHAMRKTFGAMTTSYHKAFSDPTLRDSDAILSQLPAGLYGYDLAEALGVTYIALSVIPQEPTGAWVLSRFPTRISLGNWYNQLTYYLGQQMAWQPFRKPINEFRATLGLSPASFFWGNMRKMVKEGILVIQGFSEYVVPTQPEWGDRVHTTGYWTLEEPDWQPTTGLMDFLSSGEPPVFIGFGSMPVSEPYQTTSLILESLQRAEQRVILHSGWANLGDQTLPNSVFQLDYAPYEWLFPKMKAIIHHGGSGTTGLALRSGVPSMIVPFTADQPFWGERTYQLGVGLPPIPFNKLTVENLSSAINELSTNTRLRQQAIQLRDVMKSEDGLQQAVNVINTYLVSMVH